MKITWLLTQSLEDPSGVGRYGPLARALVQMGHQVTVIALHPDYKHQVHSFVDRGVQVRYVGQMHVYKQGNIKRYFSPVRLISLTLAATLRLAQAAACTSSDLYHIGKPHPMNSMGGLLATRLKGLPLYADYDDYEAVSNRFSTGWQRKIVAFFEDNLPKAVRGITVNTRFMEKRLRLLGYPPTRISVVPNGVDRQRFVFSALQREKVIRLRQQMGIAEERPIILYVGTLSLVSHAVDLLLYAFEKVVHKFPDALLMLVGGGEDYHELRKLSERLNLHDSVVFVGRVSPAVVPFYYRLATVSVDPTRDSLVDQARFPLKIVESLAAGIPVISATVGDRPYILSDGGGMLVKPDDPQALAEAIMQLLGDPQLRDRMAQEAQSLSERFFWDNLVQKFSRIYTR